MNGILLTTGTGFEGYRITGYLGVISKEVVFRNGLMSNFSASVSNMISGWTLKDTELAGSSDLIANAKRYLQDQFEGEIWTKGGNAALGIDFETSFTNDLIRVAMSGTVVAIEAYGSAETKSLSNASSPAGGNVNEEDADTLRMDISGSNITSPFIPQILEYRIVPGGIMAALLVKNKGDGCIGDCKLELSFTNKFEDTWIAKDCYFSNFSKRKGSFYCSDRTFIEIPIHMAKWMTADCIFINKYFYNNELLIELSRELSEVTVERDPFKAVEVTFDDFKRALKDTHLALDAYSRYENASPDMKKKIEEDILGKI